MGSSGNPSVAVSDSLIPHPCAFCELYGQVNSPWGLGRPVFLPIHLASTWTSVLLSDKNTTQALSSGIYTYLGRSRSNRKLCCLFLGSLSQLRKREGSRAGQQGTHSPHVPMTTGLLVMGAGQGQPLWNSAPPSGPRPGLQRPPSQAPSHAACFLARGHAGHWLSTHAHVHAPPQHRDQAAAVHQVSGHSRPQGIS